VRVENSLVLEAVTKTYPRRVLLPVLIVTFLAPASQIRVHAQATGVAIEGGDKPIGSIVWAIHEVQSGKLIDEGRSTVRLKDVSLQDRPALTPPGNSRVPPPGRGVPKTLRLNNQFTLEMAEYPSAKKSGKSGFGLVVRRSDVLTFSWEWFVVKTDLRAEKLQEIGELGIDLTQVGTEWEVTRTEFLTDVSFRVSRMNVDQPGNFSWRVTIFKGSTITWPSLVNGRVVAN